MKRAADIVILTGAGISAESGLATFRASDGLWAGRRVEDVCTPRALAAQPETVFAFYDGRRAELAHAGPNAAHRALARLDREWPGELLIVTQNVDDLHERAEAERLIHMHGELMSALCTSCGGRQRFSGMMGGDAGPGCASCGERALRPDIVFFGEMPYAMDRIERAVASADLFVSIGTSGAVYPAAGFVRLAAIAGARTLELNLDRSDGSHLFDESRLGPATELVPAWVNDLMAHATSGDLSDRR